jgi:hypothetical protein
MLQFRVSVVTSDAGLIAYRELSGVSACESYVDGLMASTFFCAERFGRLRSYVRPGGAAHMSAGPDEVRRPGIPSDLRVQAHVSQQVVFGLRWRPCRSSRFNALAELQTVICATAP